MTTEDSIGPTKEEIIKITIQNSVVRFGRQGDSFGRQGDSFGRQGDSFGDSFGRQGDSFGRQGDSSKTALTFGALFAESITSEIWHLCSAVYLRFVVRPVHYQFFVTGYTVSLQSLPTFRLGGFGGESRDIGLVIRNVSISDSC